MFNSISCSIISRGSICHRRRIRPYECRICHQKEKYILSYAKNREAFRYLAEHRVTTTFIYWAVIHRDLPDPAATVLVNSSFAVVRPAAPQWRITASQWWPLPIWPAIRIFIPTVKRCRLYRAVYPLAEVASAFTGWQHSINWIWRKTNQTKNPIFSNIMILIFNWDYSLYCLACAEKGRYPIYILIHTNGK